MGNIQEVAYGDKIWIKDGYDVTLAEAAIQQFVHEQADYRILYTPEVYDSFSIPGVDRAMAYIVMEKVEG